jgi:hypothetical protein
MEAEKTSKGVKSLSKITFSSILVSNSFFPSAYLILTVTSNLTFSNFIGLTISFFSTRWINARSVLNIFFSHNAILDSFTAIVNF